MESRSPIPDFAALRRRLTEQHAHQHDSEPARAAVDARLRALYLDAPVAIGFSRDGISVGANPAFLRMFGIAADEDLVGTPLTDLVAPSARPDVIRRIEARKRGEPVPTRYETIGLRKDGSEFPAVFNVARVDLPEGFVTIAFIDDITERRAAEQALRDSERRARAVFDAIPDLVFRISRDGVFLDYKADIADLYYQGAPTLVGLRYRDVLPAEMADLLDARIAAALAAGDLQVFEYSLPVPNRGLRRFEARMVASGPDEVVVFVRDITHRARAEEQIRHALTLASVGQLAGGVAHDFNNNLTTIMLLLEMIQHSPGLDPDTRAALADVRTAAGRSADLTRQLLMFGQKSLLRIRALDVNVVMADLLTSLRAVVSSGATVAFEPRAVPMVTADRSVLEHCLFNLVVNARDAMPEGGTIRIALEAHAVDAARAAGHARVRPGGFVCISVSDTGRGMAPDVLAHAFEPFFTTKDVGEGKGLGLASVYGAMAQLGGWAEAESAPGQGTTIRLFLPVAAGA